MGAAERRKGQAAEREVSGLLQELLGVECVRRLGQERDGGHDVTVGPVAIQVKRQEKARLPSWLEQAEEDAPDGMMAAVAWRRSRGRWVVAMPIEDFARLVREAL